MRRAIIIRPWQPWRGLKWPFVASGMTCMPATGTNYQSFSGTYSNTYTAFDPIGRVAAFYPLASVIVSSSGSFYSAI